LNNIKEDFMIITKEYLNNNPNYIFVFGDNTLRKGKGGAAKLRDEPNSYGFITKKYPNNQNNSFYKPEEYQYVFDIEFEKLKDLIIKNPNKKFLISKLGAGLANKYHIFEEIIEPQLQKLKKYLNVSFLY